MGYFRRFRNKRGQGTTEYVMIVAVVVLGLVAAASTLIDPFKAAVKGLADNVSGWVTKNQTMMDAGTGK